MLIPGCGKLWAIWNRKWISTSCKKCDKDYTYFLGEFFPTYEGQICPWLSPKLAWHKCLTHSFITPISKTKMFAYNHCDCCLDPSYAGVGYIFVRWICFKLAATNMDRFQFVRKKRPYRWGFFHRLHILDRYNSRKDISWGCVTLKMDLLKVLLKMNEWRSICAHNVLFGYLGNSYFCILNMVLSFSFQECQIVACGKVLVEYSSR